MAEIVAGFVGAAIEVVKWVGAPIKRQFNYLCYFTRNINGLEDEAKKLGDAAGGLQGRVDTERDNLQVILPQVETCLKNTKDIKDQTTTILDQVPNVEGSGCLKLRARFSLSKRAKKTTDRVKELRDDCCKFNVISHAGPSAATTPIPFGKAYEFESRKQIEQDIMTTLRGGDASMIGICGMGGLGKTTMAKTIMNKVLKEHAFEEVAMAVVSQQVDRSKIQAEIAGQLGLNLKEETSEAVRAQKLHARLSGTKRILLVLDDVWRRLVLEDLGIPCDSKGCKILLTSRNRDAFRTMNVHKIFGMKDLSEEEAWFLFREGAGTCVDDTKLISIAKQVVQECRGLPIALTTVGAALKDEKNVSIWKDALRQLRQSDPDIPELIAQVYNPLKLSYDVLGSKQAKSVFLLCCLFPEDADIPLEYLTYFCMGLRIFEGIINLGEARDRMCALTEMLKSRSLLLDSWRRDAVRMHDVVRDVCIFIAKQEGYIGGNDCKWFSSFELRSGLGFSNLHLLSLGSYYSDDQEELIKLDNAFVEGIRDLYVLCIQSYHSLTSELAHTTQPLTNLNTLVLDSCSGLKTMSVVGELVNLEILVCRDCNGIEELPPEMKGLNRLKLLELTWCRKLQRIGRGIISSLVGLEELKMLDSFKKWEAEDRENAGLRELEALTNLRCLEIQIEDHALAAEKIHLSSKIEKFQIMIGSSFQPFVFQKTLSLELEGETCLGDWIEKQLLRDTEYLRLIGYGANNVDLAKSQNIRYLNLERCETIKNIVRTSSYGYGGATVTVFPSIEWLHLSSLPKLEDIWDGPISSTSFQNLKTLYLNDLAELKQLWKSSSQNNYVRPLFSNLSSIDIEGCPRLCNLEKDCLPQLKKLRIKRCEKLEQVFLWNKEDDENTNNSPHSITKVFPKLEGLGLASLPNLETFYQGIGGIEFPLLTTLEIEECPKMKFIASNENLGGSSSADIDDDDYAHLFCQPKKVSFGNLKELLMDRYPFCGHNIPLSLFDGLEELSFFTLHGSMSLFSSSIAENLVNLRVLSIKKCDEMLKVIEEEEKVVSGGERALLFPKLEKLTLEDLPKLVTFCEWKCDVELPSLRKVVIKRCPDMENFSLGILAAPNLEDFTTDVKNNLEIGVKVSFDSLKKLAIGEIENPFYGHKLFISLFNGLKELEVFAYKGSMSLFTSSITGNLVSLQVLIIQSCHEMVKVIEDEEEEEKVASGGERTTLLFPKLQKLLLRYLPKLVTFCELKCDVELPSLRKVEIYRCPNMKIFTMGSIAATPNLDTVRIDFKDIGGTKDLNGALQQVHLAREKERGEMAAKGSS